MDSSQDHIFSEIPGLIRVYKDGRIEKQTSTVSLPAGHDPSSGVQSKDVLISPPSNLFVRLYIPKTTDSKLPLLLFFHGGAFIIESTTSPLYHNFLNLVAAESNVVIVSVEYRLAPEHPIPACYEDSWEAIKWVAQHANGNGPVPWLNQYSDLGNVFIAGDSAGANIAHQMAVRIGSENPGGSINLQGLVLFHPFFSGVDPIGSESNDHPLRVTAREVWKHAYPEGSGLDDPFINPAMDPKVADLKCPRVVVFVAEKDMLKDRGWYYKEILARNGWKGDIEIIEDEGVDHVFFLFNPSADNAVTLRKKFCTFINQAKHQP